jgi:hypothetical protein
LSFPETGAIPIKQVQALLQLNDLIAAIHEWAAEAEGQLWAPTSLTVANTIAVAEALTPRAGCPDVTPSENGAIILDWSAEQSWATVEVHDDVVNVICASTERQTNRLSGTVQNITEFGDAVVEVIH